VSAHDLRIHTDARDAIRDANTTATQTGSSWMVGYARGSGWVCYDPCQGAPNNVAPEFLCFGLGRIPLPLGEAAMDVLFSALRAAPPQEKAQ
jgi:hypothetical protein